MITAIITTDFRKCQREAAPGLRRRGQDSSPSY